MKKNYSLPCAQPIERITVPGAWKEHHLSITTVAGLLKLLPQ